VLPLIVAAAAMVRGRSGGLFFFSRALGNDKQEKDKAR
jgi:hypothetical protein